MNTLRARAQRPRTLPPLTFTLRPSHSPPWASVAFGTDHPDAVIAWMRHAGFALGPGHQPDERSSFLGSIDAEEYYGFVCADGDIVISHGDRFVAFLTERGEVQ